MANVVRPHTHDQQRFILTDILTPIFCLVLAILQATWDVGRGCGEAFTGIFYSTFGATTFFWYSGFTFVIAVVFSIYIKTCKNQLDDYELASSSEEDSDNRPF